MSDNSPISIFELFFAFVFIAGVVIGIAISSLMPDRFMEKEAVKAGKAEYYLDADNQKQWRWKP